MTSRQTVAKVIRSFRQYVRAGDCRGARSMLQSLSALGTDVRIGTWKRVRNRFEDVCTLPRRRRRR